MKYDPEYMIYDTLVLILGLILVLILVLITTLRLEYRGVDNTLFIIYNTHNTHT
jgi:hypothetical protein